MTALIENGTYVMMTTPGNFTFTRVIVERRSLVEFSQVVGEMSISCADLIVKYEGELFMNDADIYSTRAIVESQAMFHLNGAGLPAETVPGATLADGTRAGHGGWGGNPHLPTPRLPAATQIVAPTRAVAQVEPFSLKRTMSLDKARSMRAAAQGVVQAVVAVAVGLACTLHSVITSVANTWQQGEPQTLTTRCISAAQVQSISTSLIMGHSTGN